MADNSKPFSAKFDGCPSYVVDSTLPEFCDDRYVTPVVASFYHPTPDLPVIPVFCPCPTYLTSNDSLKVTKSDDCCYQEYEFDVPGDFPPIINHGNCAKIEIDEVCQCECLAALVESEERGKYCKHIEGDRNKCHYRLACDDPSSPGSCHCVVEHTGKDAENRATCDPWINEKTGECYPRRIESSGGRNYCDLRIERHRDESDSSSPECRYEISMDCGVKVPSPVFGHGEVIAGGVPVGTTSISSSGTPGGSFTLNLPSAGGGGVTCYPTVFLEPVEEDPEGGAEGGEEEEGIKMNLVFCPNCETDDSSGSGTPSEDQEDPENPPRDDGCEVLDTITFTPPGPEIGDDIEYQQASVPFLQGGQLNVSIVGDEIIPEFENINCVSLDFNKNGFYIGTGDGECAKTSGSIELSQCPVSTE